MRAIRQKAQRTKHKVQSADLCYLERKERFELSKRVWKTRMFPATSLPRVIAAHRQLESAIGNVGTPGRIRTRNLDVRSVALFQLSYRSKEFGHGASYRIRTGVSALATPCLGPTGPTMQVVGVDRVELSPRVPKTRMLALHHTPKNEVRTGNGSLPGETFLLFM